MATCPRGDGEDVVFDEPCVRWAENRNDQSRVILFADVERPLRTRWMGAINHRVRTFMGAITASPNDEGGAEKVGVVNRVFDFKQRNRQFSRAFKKKHPKLFRTFKYSGIVLMLWLIALAPWPFVR